MLTFEYFYPVILFKVNLKHRHRGNLMVSLVSAEGTTSKLATARQHDRYIANIAVVAVELRRQCNIVLVDRS